MSQTPCFVLASVACLMTTFKCGWKHFTNATARPDTKVIRQVNLEIPSHSSGERGLPIELDRQIIWPRSERTMAPKASSRVKTGFVTTSWSRPGKRNRGRF